MSIERLPSDIGRIVADCVSVLSARVEGTQVELRFEAPPEDLPAVLTDAKRLRQILVNLVGNAIKFTEQGSITVSLGYDGQRARIEVADTGIGIPRDRQERLFQPFVQADESHARLFGGTGLGLMLSRRLARLLGGDLTFRSEAGAGSVFIAEIECPPAPASESNDDAETEWTLTKLQALAPLRGLRTMLVEDTEASRMVVKAILEACGAQVTDAESGEHALELYGSAPEPDIVFMDIRMPGIDGTEATARLRERGLACPVVALTAHALSDHRDQFLNSGFDACLTKPCTAGGLVETALRVLGMQPIRRQEGLRRAA